MLSSNGNWALTATSDDGAVHLWALEQARQIATWGAGRPIKAIQWFDNSRRIATLSEDGVLSVWDSTALDESVEAKARQLCASMDPSDAAFPNEERLEDPLFLRKDVPKVFNPDNVCAGLND